MSDSPAPLRTFTVSCKLRGRSSYVYVDAVDAADAIVKARLQVPFGCGRLEVVSQSARARDDLA